MLLLAFFFIRSIEEMIPMGLISFILSYAGRRRYSAAHSFDIFFFFFCTLAAGLIVFFSLLYVWLIIQIGTKGVMNARLFFKNM